MLYTDSNEIRGRMNELGVLLNKATDYSRRRSQPNTPITAANGWSWQTSGTTLEIWAMAALKSRGQGMMRRRARY